MRCRAFVFAVAIFGIPVLFGLSFTNSSNPIPKAQAKSPRSSLPGIVFVGAPIFDLKTDGGKGVYQGSYHWRDSYVYARSATYNKAERTKGPVRPGRNLYTLIPATPDGKVRRITHLKDGAVFKPHPHFDGKKILFSMRRDGEDWFNLYEVNFDGTNLKQLTDGPFNDFAGIYLPDGRIVFISDRTGYLEEYHEERTETMFAMNGDGTGIEQITFAPGTYFEPTLLKDGRIMFSFWDAFHIDVPPYDKHETFLMTCNPDGTEERHLFGVAQYQFFNRERHSGIGLTQPREMPDGRILVQSEMGPSIIDLGAGLSVENALTPIFPGTTSVQLGGTTHRSHLSPLGTRSTAYPLRDGRIIFSKTLPGARDSGLYIANPDTRDEEMVLNIPNHAEFDAVPILVERPRPNRLPKRHDPTKDTTKFLVVAGHESDNPERAKAMKQARYFRVIEAEYTGVTTSSHTNLETRILGTVPIFPDGSAYFEAPADTPIFLDPIDAGGNRILMEWNYPNTSVEMGLPYPATQMAYMTGRGGETRGCYGCHATQTDAVPNTPVMALKFGPVKVTRESTDLQYRRNEPNAYRRQAKLDEVEKWAKLLKSDDPELRARACEMLMYAEDIGDENVKTIANLLGDANVQVSRAAALALTSLATTAQLKTIDHAMLADDWQVRFSAQSAKAALDPDTNEGLGRGSGNLTVLRSKKLIEELKTDEPSVSAIRAVGKARLAEAVPLLIPWLTRHKHEFHAAEAAIALGRIGTKEAKDALWAAIRSEVPLKSVHIARYLQRGPRPEEYAYLKGLILSNAELTLHDLYLMIVLLPNTFMEKPRFEDRLRDESMRVLMPRMMMDRARLRQSVVKVLLAALKGEQHKNDPVYAQIVKGVNLERPFSEHGRRFAVVDKIGGEEALWLLGCLLDPQVDLHGDKKLMTVAQLEDLVRPYLDSENHRERIDAAVLLGRTGFGDATARALIRQSAKSYDFPEITSIGKGMPDFRFRDKSYLVQALAMHVDDVTKLKPFVHPRKMYRDIRYGLVRGLTRRAKADAIPLLVEMATRDPITLIRQQARYGLADIQDAYRLAGRPVPKVTLPKPMPLEAHYPPRGLKWKDTTFTEFKRDVKNPPMPLNVTAFLKQHLSPDHFRNLNNAQIRGASHMMISHIEETRQAFDSITHRPRPSPTPTLLAALDTPYPFAHYLATKGLIERGERTAIPTLIKKLDVYAKKPNPVGFWWCCDALGKFQATEAVPTLRQYATAENPAGTHGSSGMATGYAASRALGRIRANVKHAEVQRLLKSDNVWLRAGVLRGLAEANAPGVVPLLREAAEVGNAAVVRGEALVQLKKTVNGK